MPLDRGTGLPATAPGPIELLEDPRAIQILGTEHWSLLASRTMSWNEAFSRASMFLAALSAAVVALALVGQASGFGQGFIVFALVVLPFVELIGAATFARLGEANGEDIRYIQGMNRIRHAYVEAAPLLAPYFVTSHYDDLPAVFTAYGIKPVPRYSIGRRRLHYAFVTTQGLVGIIDSMLAGVFGALLAVLVGAATVVALGLGALALGSVFGLHLAYGVSIYGRVRDGMASRFPSPLDAPSDAGPAGRGPGRQVGSGGG